MNENITPVLIGTDVEKNITSSIKKSCPDAIDLTAKTSLYDIVTLARNAAVVVGNDTGPMHLAAPTGVATVVLFTKHSNPVRHAPKGDNVTTLFQEDQNEKTILNMIKSIIDL